MECSLTENDMDDRRVRKTKKALRNALASLMTVKDLRHITVKELTDTADVHRATFYTHYRDVYDLYEKLEAQVIEELSAILLVDEISSYDEWYKILVSYIYENVDICRMFFGQIENSRFQNHIGTILKESCLHFYQNSQHITNTPVIWDYLINYHVQGCISIIGLWIDTDFALSTDEIVEILMKVDTNMDKLIAENN